MNELDDHMRNNRTTKMLKDSFKFTNRDSMNISGHQASFMQDDGNDNPGSADFNKNVLEDLRREDAREETPESSKFSINSKGEFF